MADTTNIRNGYCLKFNNEVWVVVEFQHVKPGKGGAFVRVRLKNVKTGKVLDQTWRSGESIEEVRLEWKKMQYLYRDGDDYVFMDMDSYDQANITRELMSEASKWTRENDIVEIAFAEGEGYIMVQVPMHVELEITQTDPGVKGDTAQGGTKPATLETGTVIMVPLFIEEGTKVKIDTRTSEYLGRK